MQQMMQVWSNSVDPHFPWNPQFSLTMALKTLELRQKEIHACEADLQRREKKITLLQREMTRREQSINSQEIQNQALRSTITHLERKVVELKEENQLLNARNTALEGKANHPTENFKSREDEEQQRRRIVMNSTWEAMTFHTTGTIDNHANVTMDNHTKVTTDNPLRPIWTTYLSPAAAAVPLVRTPNSHKSS